MANTTRQSNGTSERSAQAQEGARKTGKSRRGFAAMDAERQREIAALGGRAAHAKGTAHQFTSEEAAAAGRIGGLRSRSGSGRTSGEAQEGDEDEEEEAAGGGGDGEDDLFNDTGAGEGEDTEMKEDDEGA